MNTKKKVLIIDDEEDACLLLKRFFLKKNFEVFCSYTLTEGLQQVSKVQPDILFLDNNLPDGFGWEASASILKNNPHLEIHLISAYNNSMFDYNKMRNEIKVWQKPISFKKLDEQLSIQKAS
jgi:two-component system, OmpR family, response regulator